ncbi:hypothetical protein MTP10_15600 [Nonomuraea sp. 3-1Str]|uniref:hypothetical protein n=1 Tax=Nonomuraea sp. 3-1Str TaxID=2929801 RepID=UPI002861B6C2|nr:hypothetical protein [Nonomuraea sp. 3-1Str]MDR8410158.1 hypothetical protein [Nonomuraea sp. 3-1Str]
MPLRGVIGIVIGTVAGLAALPVVYYLTEAGARALRTAYTSFAPGPAGLGLLAGAAVLAALLRGLSRSAALACGAPLAAVGVLFALRLDLAVELAGRLPRLLAPTGEPPGALAGATGLYALLGLVLAASAALPVRPSGRLDRLSRLSRRSATASPAGGRSREPTRTERG